MAFAKLNSDLSYWQKQTRPLFADLAWNIPEQKTGHVAIIGGNSQNFSTVIRISEYLQQKFPFRTVTTILPDSLRSKLPPLPDLTFVSSTSSGSIDKSALLKETVSSTSANLLIGDLSKNSATAVALSEAFLSPNDNKNNLLVVSRDAVDLLATESERLLQRPQTFIVASMVQLQNIFRSVYYPRMILLSQPLLPVIETLHKFTLTYPVTLVTFHQGQIIVASTGNVITTAIIDTDYSPISLWSGQLASKILALNLYNPNQALTATTAAVLYK